MAHAIMKMAPGLLLLAALSACGTDSGPSDPDPRDPGEPLQRPAYDDGFKRVADALLLSCGTFDCHAIPERNLRMPPLGASASGDEAYRKIYWSIVGLEPEILDAVVRDRGANPERLTMVRKARETEKHEGGQLMVKGDDLDVCLLSWIAGQTDESACVTVFDELNSRMRRL